MNRYLIVEKKNKLNEKIFNIKERFLLIFYKNKYIGYSSLKDAKEKIDELIYWRENKMFKTIKKYKYNGPSR